jgi:hypothetical protein
MHSGAQRRMKIGREHWFAADVLVGLCGPAREAGQGTGCRPGGLSHQIPTARLLTTFEGVADLEWGATGFFEVLLHRKKAD